MCVWSVSLLHLRFLLEDIYPFTEPGYVISSKCHLLKQALSASFLLVRYSYGIQLFAIIWNIKPTDYHLLSIRSFLRGFRHSLNPSHFKTSVFTTSLIAPTQYHGFRAPFLRMTFAGCGRIAHRHLVRRCPRVVLLCHSRLGRPFARRGHRTRGSKAGCNKILNIGFRDNIKDKMTIEALGRVTYGPCQNKNQKRRSFFILPVTRSPTCPYPMCASLHCWRSSWIFWGWALAQDEPA